MPKTGQSADARRARNEQKLYRLGAIESKVSPSGVVDTNYTRRAVKGERPQDRGLRRRIRVIDGQQSKGDWTGESVDRSKPETPRNRGQDWMDNTLRETHAAIKARKK